MNFEFLGNDSEHNPSSATCDAYWLDGLQHMADLTDAQRTLAARHPGCCILFSLDDLPQALYTSGHARMQSGIDEVRTEDLATLPASRFANGHFLGYTGKAEFAPCLRNYLEQVSAVPFDEVCAHGLTLGDDGLSEWLTYQQAPFDLIDRLVLALVVPVEQPWQALVAFPNGYFEGDLQPTHNGALARHLQQTHGYALMGVGAAYLGFTRTQPLNASQAADVAADLCALYNVDPDQRPALRRTFSAALEDRSHLWVRYVE
ncbi:hypothetical protein IAE35_05555 [Pseudomonas sp. S75]|uniref:hypothetical protein n=1 Tax=unclassified Pseudomonas TaxID=196821 RepID=UPI0019083BC2|nr:MULTISPECIES: hypothetical protein [unclassified Pseudomonas]MBJ9975228.1 hypothetical protein [Pseudomonas sp. S30]MBK0152798.1 hypothetical protein [Pseudomonas sp. S75]